MGGRRSAVVGASLTVVLIAVPVAAAAGPASLQLARWAGPYEVSGIPGRSASGVAAGMSQGGDAVVAWGDATGVRAIARRGVRGRWSPPSALGHPFTEVNPFDSPATPAIVAAAGSGGRAALAWRSKNGALWVASRTPAGRWSVARGPGGGAPLSVVVLPSGAASVLVLRGRVGSASAAVIAQRRAGGAWEADGPVLPLAAIVANPGRDLKVDGVLRADGRALVAWRTATQLLVAARPAGGVWAPQEVVAGLLEPGTAPIVASSARGDAVAFWTTGTGPLYGQFAARRFVANRNASGGPWSVQGAPGDTDEALVLAPDGTPLTAQVSGQAATVARWGVTGPSPLDRSVPGTPSGDLTSFTNAQLAPAGDRAVLSFADDFDSKSAYGTVVSVGDPATGRFPKPVEFFSGTSEPPALAGAPGAALIAWSGGIQGLQGVLVATLDARPALPALTVRRLEARGSARARVVARLSAPAIVSGVSTRTTRGRTRVTVTLAPRRYPAGIVRIPVPGAGRFDTLRLRLCPPGGGLCGGYDGRTSP